jgi:hypothetical protein
VRRKGRRIRNYGAMNESKLKKCYTELTHPHRAPLRRNAFDDAYYRCVHYGSGDPERDIREIERIAEERFVELPETK